MAALAAPFYTQAGANIHRTVSPDINVGCRFPPSSSIISLSIWSPPQLTSILMPQPATPKRTLLWLRLLPDCWTPTLRLDSIQAEFR